ncbi:DUF899 family protein [Streptomyces sp. NPDC002092]
MDGRPDHACVGCSLMGDQVARLAHLHARGTTLAFASRAPQPDIERMRARMGWARPWSTGRVAHPATTESADHAHHD